MHSRVGASAHLRSTIVASLVCLAIMPCFAQKGDRRERRFQSTEEHLSEMSVFSRARETITGEPVWVGDSVCVLCPPREGIKQPVLWDSCRVIRFADLWQVSVSRSNSFHDGFYPGLVTGFIVAGFIASNITDSHGRITEPYGYMFPGLALIIPLPSAVIGGIVAATLPSTTTFDAVTDSNGIMDNRAALRSAVNAAAPSAAILRLLSPSERVFLSTMIDSAAMVHDQGIAILASESDHRLRWSVLAEYALHVYATEGRLIGTHLGAGLAADFPLRTPSEGQGIRWGVKMELNAGFAFVGGSLGLTAQPAARTSSLHAAIVYRRVFEKFAYGHNIWDGIDTSPLAASLFAELGMTFFAGTPFTRIAYRHCLGSPRLDMYGTSIPPYGVLSVSLGWKL